MSNPVSEGQRVAFAWGSEVAEWEALLNLWIELSKLHVISFCILVGRGFAKAISVGCKFNLGRKVNEEQEDFVMLGVGEKGKFIKDELDTSVHFILQVRSTIGIEISVDLL